MHSAIYRGRVEHRRFEPVEHAFGYRLFMVYLDLAELDRVFAGRWLWSTRRRAVAYLARRDHLGDPAVALDAAVRDLVEQRTQWRPAGPIRLLTHLRYFGFCFNPVSFYYCFDASGRHVEAVVAEVNNTPWGEQHAYVLRSAEPEGPGPQRYTPAKVLHVSPFMPMDVEYDWRFGAPEDRLAVYMRTLRDGSAIFDASLDLRRVELGARSLASVLIAYPFMTARVIAAIYWQALRLWLKRCPVFDHPGPQGQPVASLQEKRP
jgi:DUF1365 family protein